MEVGSKAARQLRKLPARHRRQVLAHIAGLAADPCPPGSFKLEVLEGYRIASGEYRIAYTVDDSQRLVRVYLVFQRG